MTSRPWSRRTTRKVSVGPLSIGGDSPIVIQSMTVTDTMDTAATADQIVALRDAGCELVRVTAPSKADARNLGEIKDELRRRGADVPLVADIHFTPNAAMEACEHVEKVRVNPGNFADRKRFEVREYSDSEYAAELQRLEESFAPLARRAREKRVALRIGTNHGSLSDRILNRFGDTPLGMVESALEFVRVCEKNDHRDLVMSAKASSVRVMVESYRLMARMMDERSMPYPLHLGVTEAGEGEDGRVKSAIGIGTLLCEGIGDTIRVSLTEDPVREVPVCREILAVVGQMHRRSPHAELWDRPEGLASHRARQLARLPGLLAGAGQPPRVLLDLPVDAEEATFARLVRSRPAGMAEMPPEGLELRPRSLAEARSALALQRRLHPALPVLLRVGDLTMAQALRDESAAFGVDLALTSVGKDGLTTALRLEPCAITFVGDERLSLREAGDLLARAVERVPPGVIVAFDPGRGPVLRAEGYRALASAAAGRHPILVRASTGMPEERIRTAIEVGSLQVDGIGDIVAAPADSRTSMDALRTLYNVLQACGSRISKTEYISCPSCGRTFFDLEATTARIKEKTAHLKGVKIAVMGCIVNGPGEMADADFGYVGASPGTVHLFVGKEMVERNVPEGESDARLIALIKERGRWIDPRS